jgi:TPP-dependent pyruvate/acetoin dehydrogenase alpha subunit
MRKSPLAADCLEVARAILVERGWADEADVATWKSEAVHQVEETLAQVVGEPAPDASAEAWCALSTPGLCEGNLDPEA